MADSLAAAAPAGAGAALAVLAVFGRRRASAAEWLERRRQERRVAERTRQEVAPRWDTAVRGRSALAAALRRAGWDETPERLCSGVVLAAGASSLVLGGAAIGAGDGAAGAAVAVASAGAGAVVGTALVLARAGSRRRERLLGELCPILELVSLELSAGSSPRAALGTVASRLSGDLAREIQALLIASQVAGSPPFDVRLAALADQLRVAPLAGLAAILASSREYGISVGPGVRSLAADLRRRRRRALIAISRRALNKVLIPAAVGVLLPFMAILMFPAVAALMKSFP